MSLFWVWGGGVGKTGEGGNLVDPKKFGQGFLSNQLKKFTLYIENLVIIHNKSTMPKKHMFYIFIMLIYNRVNYTNHH